MRRRILQVPYFPQYSYNTCQTATIKMFAEYLKKIGIRPDKNADLSINGIREKLEQMGSPLDHKNWIEWFNLTFSIKMESIYKHDENIAIDFMINHINHGYPVIASVSHSNTRGHIILVYGYEQSIRTNYVEQHAETTFHVHDPYGKYDPIFNGKRNIDYGASPEAYHTINNNNKSVKKYKYPRDTTVLLPLKGEGLKLPTILIRRNNEEEKNVRLRQYELISKKPG